jgi:hypothetical protein
MSLNYRLSLMSLSYQMNLNYRLSLKYRLNH